MARNWKTITFWILGTVCILAGSMVAGHLEKGIGVTDASYLLAILVSFILLLLGGLLWISVAIAVKITSEE